MSKLSGSGGAIDVSNTSLILEQNTAGSYAGSFQGNTQALIEKSKAGEFSLSGNSSAYQGVFNVEKGALLMNGSMGGLINVKKSAFIRGRGSVNDLVIYGTIGPGDPVGMLRVKGNYVQQAGSVYEMQVDNKQHSDFIHIQGTAKLNGGTVRLGEPRTVYKADSKFLILEALGGVLGTYAALDAPHLPFLYFYLSYDPKQVYLNVYKPIAFSALATTANQIATADALETLPPTDPLYIAAVNLNTAEKAQKAFDLLSGEIHASILGSIAEESRYLREAIWQELAQPSQANNDHALWLRTFNSQVKRDTDNNAAQLNGTASGFFLGVDQRLSEQLKFGAVFGHGASQNKVPERGSLANLSQSALAVYSEYQMGAWSMRGGYGHYWYSPQVQRVAEVGEVLNYLNSHYKASSDQFFTELSHKNSFKGIAIEPLAQFAVVNAATRSFVEQSGLTALHGFSEQLWLPLSTLGLRSTHKLWQSEHLSLGSKAMLGWQHAFNSCIPKAVFAFASSANFNISGTPIAKDSAILTAGLELKNTGVHELAVDLSYQGQLAPNVTNNGLLFTFNWTH
ncbi:autotransporter domain-containing protein [Legionella sp. km772]|uniref:autotransporter outer membrane beta-barrel domain-containing protein n=1 Tax=Legionella sp. km772 TaxID=2498111 RepID=UPI001315A732|nr:autotransporter domain-containing protein [Legionella sp. km772]